MNADVNLKTRLPVIIERAIFQSRWILVPMYLGLSAGLVCYTYKFIVQLCEILLHIFSISEAELMLGVLSLVDITMVGNLIIMIMIGSFSIFVHKLNVKDEASRPQWLDNMNSSRLKVKMGMSLVGVSSIHLLKDFVNAEHQDVATIWKHGAIHTLFIISTIALAVTDKITHPTKEHENNSATTDGTAPAHRV